MNQLIAALSGTFPAASASRPVRILVSAIRPFARLWKLAEAHGLNPWVFIAMSLVGYIAQSMIFLPPFQSQAWKLVFLILLRLIALVVPLYILLKGKRIAAFFNMSVAAMFVFNTTWHVCYFVFA
ncbi:hypothetical protein ACFLSW_02410 [Candidatus Bipolaricaulota bacterium]